MENYTFITGLYLAMMIFIESSTQALPYGVLTLPRGTTPMILFLQAQHWHSKQKVPNGDPPGVSAGSDLKACLELAATAP